MTQNYLEVVINKLRQIKVVMENVKPHNSLTGGHIHGPKSGYNGKTFGIKC